MHSQAQGSPDTRSAEPLAWLPAVRLTLASV